MTLKSTIMAYPFGALSKAKDIQYVIGIDAHPNRAMERYKIATVKKRLVYSSIWTAYNTPTKANNRRRNQAASQMNETSQ